jgi:hypothetical protein
MPLVEETFSLQCEIDRALFKVLQLQVVACHLLRSLVSLHRNLYQPFENLSSSGFFGGTSWISSGMEYMKDGTLM